jgi:replication factor A1
MAAERLTPGVIESLFTDPDRTAREFPVPVLQCLQIKPLGAGAGNERYRLVLSDMRHYVQCMLATQRNNLIHEGILQRGSILKMKEYQAQYVKGKSILIVLDIEVMPELGQPEKIGEPKAIEMPTAPPQQNTVIGGVGFYAAKSEPTQETKTQIQRQINRGNGGGGGAAGAGDRHAGTLYPIEALSMYSHKWTIKARVTQKSDIKTWHKQSGEGKLFSVNLLDESGEIRATGFNEQVDQFYDMLQEGSVYYISTPCKVQLAKKQFTNLPNDYELTFDRETLIEKAEDQSSVPQVRYNFCNIQELNDVEKDATVDVIGVLKDVEEVTQITSKSTQKPYDKRELTLVDDTGYSVRVTVWGKVATSFDAAPDTVVAFKGTKVGDFGGRSLSLLSSGTMTVDPDIPEAHRLKGWYDSSGRNDSFATHSNLASAGAATGRKEDLKTISQVKEEGLGMGDQTDYFTVKATVVHIKQENFCYPACLNQGCNKKVTNDMGDGWRCEKCNQTHPRPEYRYVMSLSVNDHTGQMWLSCFDDTGRVIMGGKSADELMEMKENEDPQLAAEFEAANCRKLTFRVRAKTDTFGDQARIRYSVMSAAPLDYKSEGHKLADLIKQMSM